jgi:PHD/YefM family antitoxin component YafN of YafNO toxin-antitoxin module
MEVFTAEEFQEKWDELIERVKNGEHIGIINENGQAAVMIPVDDELSQIYINNNNEAC